MVSLVGSWVGVGACNLIMLIYMLLCWWCNVYYKLTDNNNIIWQPVIWFVWSDCRPPLTVAQRRKIFSHKEKSGGFICQMHWPGKTEKYDYWKIIVINELRPPALTNYTFLGSNRNFHINFDQGFSQLWCYLSSDERGKQPPGWLMGKYTAKLHLILT